MKIPLSAPNISGSEWHYAKECLDSGWLSSAGPFVTRFENALAQYVGSAHAIATSSGTSALHLALQVAGLKPGMEVIVPTLTFIAPINTVRYCSASPVFMDCDEYFNIDVEKVARFLETECEMRNGVCTNRASNRQIWGMLVVHVFGNPVDAAGLFELKRRYNLALIEDATESLGSRYRPGHCAETDKHPHTGTFGDLGCFSFNGNKIITTGGGGMIVTDNSELAERCRYLSTQAKDDTIRFVHHEVGYNYRLTNLQAAVGLAQLESLPQFVAAKTKNFTRYRELLTTIPGIELVAPPSYSEANHWLYALRVDENVAGFTGDELLQHFLKNDIEARPIWYLNHQQQPFSEFQAYEIERAAEELQQVVNIPCSTNLTEEQLLRVCDVIQSFASAARKEI